LKSNFPEPAGLDTAKRRAGDPGRLELAFMDNGPGPGIGGIMGPMVAVIKIVIDDDDGTVVPAERTPADIIISIIPMDPGRSPMIGGDPVPAQSQPPVPSPVMISAPTPRLVRDPVPAAAGVPDPSAIIIRPPIRIMDRGDPNISIRPFIDPIAVGGELVFVVLELGRQITFRDILILERIPVLIPIVKIIPIIRERRLRTQTPVTSKNPGPTAYELRASLAGRFDGAFKNCELALPASPHIEPV
jgi:hypothetical protein